MKTKKIIFLFAFLLGFSYCFSQSVEEKLLLKYDSQTLSQIKATNPDEYEFLCYYAEKACYVIDMPEKRIAFTELKRIDPRTGELSANQEITLEDLENFNPLEYNIVYQPDVNSYYSAGNTGKIVVVPSAEVIQIAVDNNKRVTKIK